MINFLRSSFLLAKNIKTTGAFTETSKYVAREITKYVLREQPQVIVELGAGNGNVTKAILHKMHPKSLLLSFELNADFCQNMRNHLVDNRLTIINDSAENFDQLPYAINYPNNAQIWKPVYQGSKIKEAKRDELINSYDNSINYNLNRFLKLLIGNYSLSLKIRLSSTQATMGNHFWKMEKLLVTVEGINFKLMYHYSSLGETSQ